MYKLKYLMKNKMQFIKIKISEIKHKTKLVNAKVAIKR